MIHFKKVKDLQNYLETEKGKGKKIGFVPTMGALHEGHISLAKTCKTENDICLSSIFVNPTQFNDPLDFEKYPADLERDINLLEGVGCDILFIPGVSEIYPEFFRPEKIPIGRLENLLEGKSRPGHFQGVCMVVKRLLEIVQPHQLYLGQKDLQQCMVIRNLVAWMGMKEKIHIVISPTIREPDGLAMSSRNLRLNDIERKRAPSIFQTLLFIKNNFRVVDLDILKKDAATRLTKNGFRVDYVEIARASDLESVRHWDGKEPLVALIAAYNNDVRLIDNLFLN